MLKYYILAGMTMAVLSCNPQEDVHEQQSTEIHHGDATHANEHMHKRDFMELAEIFEDPQRGSWQNIDTVLHVLGNLEGKTIADIGAGTGYFSFPLAEKAEKVIAIDIDQRFLNYIQDKKDSLQTGSNIELRLTEADKSGILDNEVDMAIIVNTYHHIENRIAYFTEVRSLLNEGGVLVVIDFFKEELSVGPPPDHKLAAEVVLKELKEAGFKDISIEKKVLTYQYIITANIK